jgi:general secretion pathway protein I
MAKAIHRATGRAGFTLLEVMIALAILAVSLVAIAGINSSAIDMHVYSKRLTVATLLARAKMVDIETKLMSDDLPADDAAEEGTFDEDGFPEYHWQAEIIRPKTENVTPADLLAATGLDSGDPSKQGSSGSAASPLGGLMDKVPGMAPGMTGAPQGQQAMMASAVTGGGGMLGGAMAAQVQTLLDMFGKTVREVRLTVSWQTGKITDQFTIVTHVVSMGRGTDQVNSDPAAQAALAATNPSGAGSANDLNAVLNAAGVRTPGGLPPGFPGGLPGSGLPGTPSILAPGGVRMPVGPRIPSLGAKR